MATRKAYVELLTADQVIARGANTVGGTVIGDYIKDGSRVVVVKMPKVEKKAGAKKQKKATPVAKAVQDAVDRQGQYADAGVSHGS